MTWSSTETIQSDGEITFVMAMALLSRASETGVLGEPSPSNCGFTLLLRSGPSSSG